ncbi:MAG: nucleoside deaminase [Phycisphaerae bacterium]
MFELPPSIEALLPTEKLLGDEDAARLAIRLAEEGSRRGLGGPFGAIILDREARTLVAAGVNLVIARRQPIAHAEIVAIANAHAGDHPDVACGSTPTSRDHLELVTSCEPCAMCYGAMHWAGLSRLVCCARTEDAEQAGFDEGAKPADWADHLRQRGIEVVRDVLRAEAIEVLSAYAARGGLIY